MLDSKRLLDSFRANSRSKNLSENTIVAYTKDVEIMLDFFRKEIWEVTKDDIEKYIHRCQRDKLSIKTINRRLVAARQFANFVNEQESIKEKINVSFKRVKFQKQEYLEDMLEMSDFDRMVKAAEKEGDKRAVAIFYTLFLTGARVSEMIQMEPRDVEEKIVTVKGKGAKYRNLFMPKKAREYLSAYLKERIDKGEGLFTGREGTISRQTVHNIIKKYAGLARVKLTRAHAHNFRHLFCMYLVEEGLTIDEIADLAGHSDINITRIYTRKTKKELLAAINNLGTKKRRRVRITTDDD